MLDIKIATDELALLNHPIENDDLVLYIVNGLSQRLKDIFAAIRTRTNSITFEELHEQLVEHEFYLLRMDSSSNMTGVLAHVANKTNIGSFSFSS